MEEVKPMRPQARIWIAGIMTASALALAAPGPAKADLLSFGIVVDEGTVQPIGDPRGLYTFDVVFNPNPATGEFVQMGDSFTITLAGNPQVIPGTNGQPADWAETAITTNTVTWSFIGDTPITTMTPLDPTPPFFEVEGVNIVSGTFSYTYIDSLPNKPHGNTGGGTFVVPFVPEPSSLALVALGAPAALCLSGRLRRRSGRA
jgi:hypothetical protein